MQIWEGSTKFCFVCSYVALSAPALALLIIYEYGKSSDKDDGTTLYFDPYLFKLMHTP